jgi:REP element-mobilizing transposase RayT
MSDSYTNLLYHIVFSTKERRPLITPEYEPRLYEYIGGIVRGLGGISLELNGTEDHVHLLAKLRPDRALSDVLRKLKANATGWMHDVFPQSRTSHGSVDMAHYGESVKCCGSKKLSKTTERASRKDLISGGIHSVPESKRHRVRRTIRLSNLCRPLRGLTGLIGPAFLGFRYASPQTLCSRPLRGLFEPAKQFLSRPLHGLCTENPVDPAMNRDMSFIR